jgi:hypothetical protein
LGVEDALRGAMQVPMPKETTEGSTNKSHKDNGKKSAKKKHK